MKPSIMGWKSGSSAGGLQRKHSVGFGVGKAVVACGTSTRGGSCCCLLRLDARAASVQVSALPHWNPPVSTHG